MIHAALGVYLLSLGEFADAQLPTMSQDSLDQYPTSEHDRRVSAIESFDDVLEGWERRARTGNIMSTYDVQVIATYDPGEPRFEPQPGKTYFYENLGTSTAFYSAGRRAAAVEGNQVVVGDAETKEVIASYMLAPELRSSMHTTFMSPDGRYVYIIGSPSGEPTGLVALAGSASLVKVDALTLQPVKQMNVGGRLHHGQIFRDEYLLIDTFGRDDDGLDLFLFDPETDQIIGGVRDEDLGGATYTAYTDDEYIYVLMEPVGYGPMALTGYIGATNLGLGRITALRPFWGTVSELDVPFYLHPRMQLPSRAPIYDGHPWLKSAPWGFAIETSIHSLRMCGSGMFDAYPNLKIIIGHLGEHIPYDLWRIVARMRFSRREYRGNRPLGEYFLDHFYITTSGNFQDPAF